MGEGVRVSDGVRVSVWWGCGYELFCGGVGMSDGVSVGECSCSVYVRVSG